MTDLMLFFGSGSLIFGLLFLRFMYMKTLTGVGSGGSVSASYWGNYGGSTDDSLKIKLPKTPGLCPRCGSKSIGYNKCAEH
jgi:hypothetical protein